MTGRVLVGAVVLLIACSGQDSPPDARSEARPKDRALEAVRDSGADARQDHVAPDGPAGDRRALDAPPDAPPKDKQPGDTTKDFPLGDTTKDAKGDKAKDAQPDAASCPGTGTALVGPSGGTLFSADCKARLAVPAGALSAPTQLTMTAATPPPGAVTISYDIGPTGLVFSTPVTLTLPYVPGALGGATESKLTMGSATAGEWAPVGNSTVSMSAHEVSSLLGHLSTYGGIPGDATGPVAKVVPLGPAGGAGLGENGGASPIAGVPLNASWFPLAGRSVSYQVSSTSLASIDAQGMLTAGSLGFPPLPASVTVTATVDAISGMLPVSVVPKAASTVVASGSYSVQGRTGVSVGNLQLSHVQNPTTTLTIGPSGTFSALPPLPAGSFYTIKLEKAGYLPTYHTWWSLVIDTSVTSRAYPLYDAADVAALTCATTVDPAKGHVLISGAPPPGQPSGWEYSVSSPGATVRYLAAGGTPDCAAVNSSAGGALVLNVAPGYHWVMGKQGLVVVGVIVYIPSGGSITLLTFS